nr:unnamed protein product [Digitaria exilis]
MLGAALRLRLRVLRRRPRVQRHRSRSRGGRAAGAEDVGREPVLLVSGMGGSVLHARRRSDPKFDLRVWVRILFANLDFKKYLWSLYNAETGYVEPLDDDVEIVVPEDDHGLYAIDILDPSWFVELLHLSMVYHFHDMIDMLINCGYEKGTTLFGYGYDFRQSNRIDKAMSGLKSKLETAYKTSGGKKVFAKYINKWICIACPFQGAPGCINDSLLTGLQFVYGFESFFFVSRWAMHQMLTYNGKKVPLPFNMAVFKWATETRRILENAELPDTVSFYNIYGTSYETPYDVWLPMSQVKPEYTYVDGDCTVPIESAMADGFAAKERVGVKADHRGLLSDENVFELLKKWLGASEKAQRRRHVSKAKVLDLSC